MRFKAVSVFLTICVLLTLFFTASAAQRHNLGVLKNCREIFAYSGSSAAYFYGTDRYTLYSAQVIPGCVIRSAKADGIIHAVSHDEENAYAFFKSGEKYGVLTMNIKSGKCENKVLDSSVKNHHGFAAVKSESCVVVSGDVYSCALGFSGDNTYKYSFPANVDNVFTNGGSIYARLSNGKIYRIQRGEKILAADLGTQTDTKNAGFGWVRTSDGRLVNLEGKCGLKSNTRLSVCYDGKVFSFNCGIAAAAANGNAALLTDDYFCDVSSSEEEPSTFTQTEPLNGGSVKQQSSAKAQESVAVYKNFELKDNIITGISAGMTVSAFKETYGVNSVKNAYGNAVAAGKMKTGYTAVTDRGEYTVAVTGDINSNGLVNNADLEALMECFAKIKSLGKAAETAADINSDGYLDNVDLLLLSRRL